MAWQKYNGGSLWVDDVTKATAARMNNLEDGIQEARKDTYRPLAQLAKSADQTGIVTATWTKVTFESIMWDNVNSGDAAQFDNANDRLYPRRAGIYLVYAMLEWDANTTGDRGAAWYRNGSLLRVCSYVKSANGVATVVTPFEGLYLNPAGADGEHLELWAFQNSGANRTLSSRSKFGWAQINQT